MKVLLTVDGSGYTAKVLAATPHIAVLIVR